MMERHDWFMRGRIFLLLLVGMTGFSQTAQLKSDRQLRERFTLIRQFEDPAMTEKLIRENVRHPDPVIRQRVLYEAFTRGLGQSESYLRQFVRDTDKRVIRTLIDCIRYLKSPEQKKNLLSEIARNNSNPEFRRMAAQANFPFFRVTQRLKDDPTNDHAVEILQKIELSSGGWLFRTDPQENGHFNGFYLPDHPDSNWKKIRIGTWESQGFPDYDGIGWYRLRFKMPPKPENCRAVELEFGAVDESAWVWLNGKYIGQHDMGPYGWDKTFWLDVRNEILWGRENILAVRVKDTAGAGGIWKPVWIEFLR